MMKLLPVLLLTCALSLGVACASEPAVPPTATPDVPTLSEGEAIALVQGMLRAHPNKECHLGFSFPSSVWLESSTPRYEGKGKWRVAIWYNLTKGTWYVYEGSYAVETVKGPC
jgi:hypothetical protein